MHRFDQTHEQFSIEKAKEILRQASYSESEIEQVIVQVIEPHSCKDGNVPTTIEGKVMATGDALAHLTTDFYLQFVWKHLPEGKDYQEFSAWVAEKLDRDFHNKIFFNEVREMVQSRYEALKEVFVNK